MTARRRVRWSQLRIGLLATTLLLATAISIFFVDQVRDAIEDRYTLYFNTFTTQTLRPRAPVWLAGQPVGHVQGVTFRPPARGIRNRLRVALRIRAEARPYITEGARAQIITAGRLGEALVNILPADRPGAPLEPGSELPTASELDLSDLLKRLRATLDSLPPIVARWAKILELAREGPGSVALALDNPDQVAELHVRAQRAAATFDTLGMAATGLTDLLEEPSVREALSRLADRFPRLARRWRGGSAAAIYADSTLLPRLRDISQRIARLDQRLQAGQGSLGRFLEDRALATEWARTHEMLEQLVRDLNRLSTELNP